ncbi:MAG: LamG domain-containing protein, partial [Planctomycetaceae bacterium]|nr:LamG domain-containing protein [Planctomycetaceae bacterium]
NNVFTGDGSSSLNAGQVTNGTSTLSVTALVRTTATGNSIIIGEYDATNNDRAWAIQHNVGWPGKALFVISSDGTNTASTAKVWASASDINDGKWHRITFTFDNGTLRIWIDGVEETATATKVTDASITSIHDSVADFALFAQDEPSAPNYLAGDAADVRVSTSVFSDSDVSNINRDGVPAIRGEEALRIDPASFSGSGGLIDQTGGGNDGELQGTATVTGGVLALDGTDQCHARVPATGIGLEKGTIVARMRFGLSGDDTEGTAFLWDCDDVRIALYRNGASRNELRMFVDQRYRDFDPHEWDADTTYTVAMVYEKATDTLQLYWDGLAIAGETNQGTWGSTALGTYLRIGASISGTGNLTAEYDWLNVYDEVLTADQIAFLSANGNADPFYEPPLASNPSTGFSGILSARNTCKPRLITGIRA